MPFIGKDWRSPGEVWIKTEALGWQRAKIVAGQVHLSSSCTIESVRRPKSSQDTTINDISSNDHKSSSSSSWPPKSECEELMARGLASTINDNNNEQDKNNDTRKSEPMTIPSGAMFEFEASPVSSPSSSRLLQAQQIHSTTTTNLSVSDIKKSTSNSSQHNCGMFCDTTSPLAGNDNKVIREHNMHQQQYQQQQQQPKLAPHCQILLKPTREVAMYKSISEAFCQLDFCNAIHDIRRFNYICKLLHLLITQNLTSLSGCATKILFSMLEHCAIEAASNKRNIHVIKNLLNDLKLTIQKYYCWGRPIGSSLLWQQHFETIEKISEIVDNIKLAPEGVNDDNSKQKIDDEFKSSNKYCNVAGQRRQQTHFDKNIFCQEQQNQQPANGKENKNKNSKTINDLPVEMIREILLRLNDYRDIINAAQVNNVMHSMICDGQFIWRQLCRYHFTNEQVELVIRECLEAGSGKKLKYAKFVSADGKRSYRQPVAYKQRQVQRSLNSTELKSQDPVVGSIDKCKLATNNDKTRSFVLRTVQKFDDNAARRKSSSSSPPLITNKISQKSPINLQRSLIDEEDNKENESNDLQGEPGERLSDKSKSCQDKQQSSSSSPFDTKHGLKSIHSINWEALFHMLRKKFDLKEEYADCLLLCRYCRCLFWQSFGHPCPVVQRKSGVAQHTSEPSTTKTATNGGSPANQAQQNAASKMQHFQQQVQQQPSQAQFLTTAGSRRLSVAALSKTFDPNSSASTFSNRRNRLGASTGRGGSGVNDARIAANIITQPQSNQQQLQRRQSGAKLAQVDKKRELVPMHVAVSPQAFLKFFSL